MNLQSIREHKLVAGTIILIIGMLGLVFIPPLIVTSPIVTPYELKNYLEEYLSQYVELVDENYALLSFPQSYLSNFSFYANPPTEIKGVISRSHGVALFFNSSDRKAKVRITIEEVWEPIEYYIWPDMPENTSDLESVLVKAGDYHLDSPVIYDYGLLYLEPGVEMRYTGEGEGLRISGEGAITVLGVLIYEDRMMLKGTNSHEDWSEIQARFDALSEFLWDCRYALNETQIEEIDSENRFFLLLERITLRMRNGQYLDNPDLFKGDYEELEKVCTSNATLSKVLNDYLEMQENPPRTLIEQIFDLLFPYIIAPVIVAVILAILYGVWRWIKSPKMKIEFDERDRNHIGIFRYYRTRINRKHARVHVFNHGKTDAKKVRGVIEIIDGPVGSPHNVYLHWADTPFGDPESREVDIPRDGGFKILDVVFSQPSDDELHEDFGDEVPIFTGTNTEVSEYHPTPGTIPPEALRSTQLETNRMGNARPSGCYIAANLALWSPNAFPQYHLPPGEYKLRVTLIGENIRKISMSFRLTSPENWSDMTLQKM